MSSFPLPSDFSSDGDNELDDEILSQFLAFTGSSDSSVARHYLEMSGNDLETAVSLFMDTDGGTVHPSTNGNVSGLNSVSAGASAFSPEIRAPDRTRTMRLLDSPGVGEGVVPATLMAAMMPGVMDHHDDETLADMGAAWATRDLRETVNREAERRRSRASAHAAPVGGYSDNARRRRRSNTDDDDDDDEVQVVDQNGQVLDQDIDYSYDDSGNEEDDDDDMTPSAHNLRGQPPSLSTMFAAPTHLIHHAGGFMGAKNFAKDARRWLLVNVQCDSTFACHALNRDVWSDELVENLIRDGFIFWQTMSTSSEGLTYIARYKVERYPHIAILDPRTGTLLWKKEGWTQINPLTAEQFVEIASDFCSRHSFDKLPSRAHHGYTNTTFNDRHVKRTIQELSEEEQLQAAIRASMKPSEDPVEIICDGDDDDDDNDAEMKQMDKTMDCETISNLENAACLEGLHDQSSPKNELGSKPSALNTFEREILTMDIGDEPTGNVPIARVQIRMPDGKRLVRKFNGEDQVKVIYAFVAQSNDDAKNGKLFELKAKFPLQDLIPSIDKSISSCALSGEAIQVVWK